jgi:hypothetical protein
MTTDLQSVPFGRSGIPPDEELKFTGADDGTRTRNLLITSQLLYQLSYASLSPAYHPLRFALNTAWQKRIPFLKQNVFGVNIFFSALKIIFSKAAVLNKQ